MEININQLKRYNLKKCIIITNSEPFVLPISYIDYNNQKLTITFTNKDKKSFPLHIIKKTQLLNNEYIVFTFYHSNMIMMLSYGDNQGGSDDV